jgi:predicted Rossmann fold nucleotide-binding protein DprA/Smf involved in DNA uptake
VPLQGFEKKIYDMLSDDPVHIDSIIDRADLSAPFVARLLTQMEVRKLIRELPGKNFAIL